MATLNDSLLSGASGKLDGYVIYRVGKKTYMRKLAENVSNPRTDGQTMQRAKLPGAQTMYRAMRDGMLKDVLDVAAREEERRSGYHWFLHANMNVFGKEHYIDYSRLKLTAGSLQLPFEMKMIEGDETYALFSWIDNSGSVTAQATDRLLVAAIFDDEPYSPVVLEMDRSCRSDGAGVVNLPEGTWKTVHLYCFFASETERRYSPCRYFSISKS